MSDPFDEPLGLGDRLDDLLVRLEAWSSRSRPLAVVVVAVLLVVWSLGGRGAGGGPVDDRIPMAAPAVDSSAVDSSAGPPPSSSGEPGPGPGSADDGASGGDPADEPGRVDGPEAVVHVVGAVRRPGLVTLGPGARIGDAVTAAGGAIDGADVDRLNLAAPVVDGMQIRVPLAAESGPGGSSPGGVGGQGVEPEPLVRLPTPGPGGGSGGGGSGGGAGGGPGVDEPPIDLNLASAAELERLPGIGPALAGRIVTWREEQGRFASVDDLEAVPGIGPAKLAALRDLVVV